jgi:hypothetical protein
MVVPSSRIFRISEQRDREFVDSPLEGSGFELPVPLKNGVWKHDRTVRSGRI